MFRSSHRRCSLKKAALKNFCNIYKKTPVLESLFCEYCDIFKNTYFEEQSRTTTIECFLYVRTNLLRYFNCSCNCRSQTARDLMYINSSEMLNCELLSMQVSNTLGHIRPNRIGEFGVPEFTTLSELRYFNFEPSLTH